jgi:hypothetical protein
MKSPIVIGRPAPPLRGETKLPRPERNAYKAVDHCQSNFQHLHIFLHIRLKFG